MLITEGEKKAAAACKVGYNCIGLGGVNNFKSKNGFLTDWDNFVFTGRTVLIVYDSDIIDKPPVRYAEYALTLELVAKGAIVMRVRLPHKSEDKTGLDDFLVANGLPEDVQKARVAFEQLPREKIDTALPPHLTELGNAIRLEQEFGERLRYAPKWGDWIVCNLETGLWQIDSTGEAIRCAKQVPYMLRKEAKKLTNDQHQEALLKWSKQSESAKAINATIALAKTESGLIIDGDIIDSNPWKIALKNGVTIDLKLGVLQKVSPNDHFMKSVDIEYNPNARCPKWDKFLLEIMQGDKKLVGFLQRSVGYSLTGDMSAQCIFIAYGHGANGKSTFLNTLLALLGEYGRQAASQTFMASKSMDASTPRSDLCRLVGIRLVATSETENYQRLSEAFIKQWTGGEQIATRNMYGKTFEFYPQGKIWLATNHIPQIRGTDDAIWRRIFLIPFTRTFAENERDSDLPNKLKAELSGILNWALRGCKEWQEKGLNPPDSVIEAVAKYRANMDSIGEWIKEKCDTGKNCKQLISKLFDDFKTWAHQTEEFVFKQKDFTQYLEERGYEKKQTTDRASGQKGWFIIGMELKKDNYAKFAATPRPRKKTS